MLAMDTSLRARIMLSAVVQHGHRLLFSCFTGMPTTLCGQVWPKKMPKVNAIEKVLMNFLHHLNMNSIPFVHSMLVLNLQHRLMLLCYLCSSEHGRRMSAKAYESIILPCSAARWVTHEC